MDEVLKSARPLSDILWMRETESGAFETPERHAALEGHHEARFPHSETDEKRQCAIRSGRTMCALSADQSRA
jgi:hypothetical protein